MRRLLLFDLDGTLVDVDGAGREALRRAMVRVYGETGPIDGFEFHGKTDPAIVRGLLRQAGWEDRGIDASMPELWTAYLETLDAALQERVERVRAYPGVRRLLDELGGDRHFSLGLVTGNVRGGAWRKLDACGLDGWFDFGAFGSDSEHRDDLPPLAMRRAAESVGHDFRAEEAWIIGDTPADVQCGRRSGLRTLGVATGKHDEGALRASGAEWVVAGLEDTEEATEIFLS